MKYNIQCHGIVCQNLQSSYMLNEFTTPKESDILCTPDLEAPSIYSKLQVLTYMSVCLSFFFYAQLMSLTQYLIANITKSCHRSLAQPYFTLSLTDQDQLFNDTCIKVRGSGAMQQSREKRHDYVIQWIWLVHQKSELLCQQAPKIVQCTPGSLPHWRVGCRYPGKRLAMQKH